MITTTATPARLPPAASVRLATRPASAWLSPHGRPTTRPGSNPEDDLIIEPATGAATLPSRGVRLLAVGANWIMVVYGAISFVLFLALYPNN